MADTPREGDAGGDAQELAAVAEFLRGSLPFNELASDELGQIVRALRVSYAPQGSRIDLESEPQGLRILRSGAVDLRDHDNKLLDRLGEGESFHIGGLNAERVGVVATVIEDALIYRLPNADYQAMRRAHRAIDRYFSGQRSRRLRRAARYQPEANAMLAPVHSVMSRRLLTASPQATVHQAAVAMANRRVSSILIVEDSRLLGIVTDRDLRTRVLAESRKLDTPITEVMTPEPDAIDAGDSIFATTLLMMRRGFHHLPVFEKGVLAGVVTTSDLIVARRDDPVHLVQHISRQDDAKGICDLLGGVSNLMVHWVNGGMRARHVSQILTAISDAVAVRLIELAVQELGDAPQPWAWLGFGSQARAEQLLGADQDNGIVIADSAVDADLAWYRELAQRVCDGLAACGYRYCPGGIMATNEHWCLRLRDWQDTVRRWARAPTADALMRVSIFFDIRPIYGSAMLADDLQQVMLEVAGKNTIFQAALAASVLGHSPPLGIFRRFVVERNGEHRDSFDIKKRGVLPVTEIARLHALARGISAVNTDQRLEALAREGHLSMADSRNLIDALHCLQRMRMRHQCEQVQAGNAPNNFVNPRSLPRLAREQLRDAFTIIDEAQSGIRQTYRAGMG